MIHEKKKRKRRRSGRQCGNFHWDHFFFRVSTWGHPLRDRFVRNHTFWDHYKAVTVLATRCFGGATSRAPSFNAAGRMRADDVLCQSPRWICCSSLHLCQLKRFISLKKIVYNVFVSDLFKENSSASKILFILENIFSN